MASDRTRNPFEFPVPSDGEDRTEYVFEGPDVGEIEHRVTVTVDRYPQWEGTGVFAQGKTRLLMEERPCLDLLMDDRSFKVPWRTLW